MENVIMNLSERNLTKEVTIELNKTSLRNSTVTMPLHVPVNVDDDIFMDVQNFVLFPIVICVGLFGNMSTISIFWKKTQKTASNIFILGLACTDFLFLLLRVIAHIYKIGHIHFSESFRYIIPNGFFWSLLAHTPQRSGFLFIIVIVLERITAVWFPFKLKQIWTTRLSRTVSIVVVLLPMGDLVTLVDSLLFSIYEGIPYEGEVTITSEAGSYFQHQGEFMRTWSVFHRICFDLLPLPLVFILNIVIIVGIRRNTFSREGWNMKTQQRKKKEGKTTRMLLIISLSFFFLCGPFNVLINLSTVGLIDEKEVKVTIYGAFVFLNILNSVINFVVYGVNDSNLRKEYLKLWRCRSHVSSDSDPNRAVNKIFNLNNF